MMATTTTAEDFAAIQKKLAAEKRRERRKAQAEALADDWERQMASYNLGPYVKEHRFHQDRKWRFDYAFPTLMVAVEIDGGTWISGRHSRGIGYRGDCEKMAEAAILGWRVLRFTSDMVKDGTAVRLLGRALWTAGGRRGEYPKIMEEVE
jgi:very-short-patch-repair endonuclease